MAQGIYSLDLRIETMVETFHKAVFGMQALTFETQAEMVRVVKETPSHCRGHRAIKSQVAYLHIALHNLQ